MKTCLMLMVLPLCLGFTQLGDAQLAMDSSPSQVTAIDFDLDGDLDLITGEGNAASLRWFRNTDGELTEISEVEAVDPWRLEQEDCIALESWPAPFEGTELHLFAMRFAGWLRVVDIETGHSYLVARLWGEFGSQFNSLTSDRDGTLFQTAYELPQGGELVSIDAQTAEVSGTMNTGIFGFDNRGMAWHPDGQIYVIDNHGSEDEDTLYRIDTATGVNRRIGFMGDDSFQALAFHPDGRLFAWALGGNYGLHEIFLPTGRSFRRIRFPREFKDQQALAFAPDGTLYGARDYLDRLDIDTRSVERIGPLMDREDPVFGGANIRGLAFARARIQPLVFGMRNGKCPLTIDPSSDGWIRGFICGSDGLQTSSIVTESIRLNGVVPVERVRIQDVAGPPSNDDRCVKPGADGHPDLVFRVRASEILDSAWSRRLADQEQLDISAQTVSGELLVGSMTMRFEEPDNSQQGYEAVKIVLDAHPNPFNPRTTISLNLDRPAKVAIIIYDARGRRVRSLHDGALSAGKHEVIWDGESDTGQRVASGIYRAILRWGNTRESIPLVLVK